MPRPGTPGRPTADPTGDLRAGLLARLEYGVMAWDDRADMAFRLPPARPRCARCRRRMLRGTEMVDSPRGLVHERWCKPAE